MLPRLLFVLLFLTCICLVAGCGDDDTVNVVTPKVTQTFPEDGATGLSLFTPISIWFSREMDEASLDSIFVDNKPASMIEYVSGDKRAIVYADTLLEAEAVHEVLVSSYAMDTGGNNLASDYTFSFTTGPLDCAHLQDRFEPNDDVLTATPVELNVTYNLLSSCGDAERRDLFRFTVGDTVKVTAKNHVSYSDSTRANFLVEFLRPDGAEYTAAGMLGHVPGNMDWYKTVLPGTYIVSTGKYHDDQYLVAYDLTLETSEPCIDDEYEDNDFFDEAPLLSPGNYTDLRACMQDKDYYMLDLEAGQTLEVTFTQTSTPERLRRLLLYNSDYDELARVQSSSSPTTAGLIISETGTYYVGLIFWNDDIVYDLLIDVTGP
jgi:hypothetical protein